jgi:hypothetical protein
LKYENFTKLRGAYWKIDGTTIQKKFYASYFLDLSFWHFKTAVILS